MKQSPDFRFNRKFVWLTVGCVLALVAAWLVPELALLLFP